MCLKNKIALKTASEVAEGLSDDERVRLAIAVNIQDTILAALDSHEDAILGTVWEWISASGDLSSRLAAGEDVKDAFRKDIKHKLDRQ